MKAAAASEPPPGGVASGGTPVARQSGLVILNSVLGAAQGFLALFVIARYMGADALGGRAIALTLVALAGTLARLGLPTTHVRRLARGHDLGASNGTYLLLKSSLTALFMALAGAAMFLWFEVLDRSVTDTTPTALWLAYWIVVAQSLRDIPVNSFQGLRRIREREAVLLTNTIVTVLLTVWVGLAYAHSHGRWIPVPGVGEMAAAGLGVASPLGANAGIDLLMAAFLAGELASLALAAVLFARLRLPVARPRPGMMAAYLRSTMPVTVLAVGEVATKWLGYGLLWVFWDRAEVGQFDAAAKLNQILLLLGTGIAIVLLPAVSQLHRRGEAAEAHRMVREAERWTSLLLWPAVAGALVLPGAIVHVLLSDQFAGAIVPLGILAVQSLTICLLLPAQTLAVGTGATGRAAWIVAVSVAADALLGLLLIPERLGPFELPGLGATGAALAALASAILALFLYSLPGGKWAGHSFVDLRLAKHAGAALAAGLLLLVLPLPAPERYYTLGLQAGLLLAVYVAILVAVGELRRKDWDTVRNLLRREGGPNGQDVLEA